MAKKINNSVPNRAQTLDILNRFRSAKTERDRRKVANSLKKEFPTIAEKLTHLINEGSTRAA
jgi:hypothetical protein